MFNSHIWPSHGRFSQRQDSSSPGPKKPNMPSDPEPDPDPSSSSPEMAAILAMVTETKPDMKIHDFPDLMVWKAWRDILLTKASKDKDPTRMVRYRNWMEQVSDYYELWQWENIPVGM